MFDRKLFKEKGKAAFKANYWPSVIVAFILSLVTGSATSSSGSRVNQEVQSTGLPAEIADQPEVAFAILAVIFGIVLVVGLVLILFDIFVINPLRLGCNSFFLKNSSDSTTKVGTIKDGFNPYLRNVKALFRRDLFIFLWSLLLIVPGIIKAIEYRLVPYILAENPEMTGKEAMERSKQLMTGHKWESFVMDLSFIGWIIVGILSLGIALIFYVEPYMECSYVEMYKGLKEATY